jgi:hypothetical protein
MPAKNSWNGTHPLPRLAENELCPPRALESKQLDHRNANCYRPWILGIGTFLYQLSRNVWGNPSATLHRLPDGRVIVPGQ